MNAVAIPTGLRLRMQKTKTQFNFGKPSVLQEKLTALLKVFGNHGVDKIRAEKHYTKLYYH
jgi:hypothetical protein